MEPTGNLIFLTHEICILSYWSENVTNIIKFLAFDVIFLFFGLNKMRILLFQGDSPFGKSEAYIKLEQLGEGSYATVYKGYSK